VRRARLPLSDDAHNFAQLFAQSFVGVQPSSGVDEHRVDATSRTRFDGIKRDRGGVGPLARVCSHERDAQAVGPGLELFGCAGAKRVGSREQHASPLLPQPMRELGDSGGLAGPIHSKNQHDRRRLLRARERRGRRAELFHYDALECLFAHFPATQLVDDFFSRPNAEVRFQQQPLGSFAGRAIRAAAERTSEPCPQSH